MSSTRATPYLNIGPMPEFQWSSVQSPFNRSPQFFQREPISNSSFNPNCTPLQRNTPISGENSDWYIPQTYQYKPTKRYRQKYDSRSARESQNEYTFQRIHPANNSVASDGLETILKILDRQQRAISKLSQDFQESSVKAEKANEIINKRLQQIETTIFNKEKRILRKIQTNNSGFNKSISNEDKSIPRDTQETPLLKKSQEKPKIAMTPLKLPLREHDLSMVKHSCMRTERPTPRGGSF